MANFSYHFIRIIQARRMLLMLLGHPASTDLPRSATPAPLADRDRIDAYDVLGAHPAVVRRMAAMGVGDMAKDFDPLVAEIEKALDGVLQPLLAGARDAAVAAAERCMAADTDISSASAPRELVIQRGCNALADIRVFLAARIALNRVLLASVENHIADAPRVRGKAAVLMAHNVGKLVERIRLALAREDARVAGKPARVSETAS
ncbi:MAG: hypothetical protein K2P80_05170 [Beijerinckiaceae bacterium]|nr:hypothetical protein [Beijerinckiaceae bacterium]